MPFGSTPRPGPAARPLIPHSDTPSRALSLLESRSTMPRTPRKSRKTLERFLEFIEQEKVGKEWKEELEGELEGEVFELLKEWKKQQRGHGTCTVKTRKSYTWEFKLQTLTLLHTGRMKRNGRYVKISKYQVAQSVGITKATLRGWELNADKILNSKKGSRKVETGRGVFWPHMEEQLVQKFREARERGIAIYRGWFLHHAKQLFRELYPEEVVVIPGCTRFIYPLKFSSSWFRSFRARYRISWCMKTNVAQVSAQDKVASLQCYLQFIWRNSQLREGEIQQDVGRYRLGHIYNMDQTPLPFEFLRGCTYEFKGKKTVWILLGASRR